MSLKTLRAELKTALTSANKYSIYDVTPETVIPPAVVVTMGQPWLEPLVIGNNRAYKVRFVLEVVTTLSTSNKAALENLEDEVQTVLGLIPLKYSVLEVSAPTSKPANVTDLLAAEIRIETAYNP